MCIINDIKTYIWLSVAKVLNLLGRLSKMHTMFPIKWFYPCCGRIFRFLRICFPLTSFNYVLFSEQIAEWLSRLF